MTIAEFVKEQVEARAKAATELKEPLEINGIKLEAGCTKEGIEIDRGIDKLADILGTELTVTSKTLDSTLYECKQTTSFEFCGARFFETDYLPKGTSSNV